MLLGNMSGHADLVKAPQNDVVDLHGVRGRKWWPDRQVDRFRGHHFGKKRIIFGSKVKLKRFLQKIQYDTSTCPGGV